MTLTEPGPHKVAITYASKEVPKSPFTVNCLPDDDKVKAFGPGLKGGKANTPCTFTVDTREATKPGGVGVTIDGPKEAKIDCKDNGNGTCEFTYYPVVPGNYKVNVTYAEKPIKESPFQAKIAPGPKLADQVKAYGPGLKGGKANTPCKFTVDTRAATMPGGVGVTIDGPKEAKIDCKDNGDGTCEFTYFPVVPGSYKVNVTYAEAPITGSPFNAKVEPGIKPEDLVKAYGPGLKGGKANTPCTFTVDSKESPIRATVGVTVDGPKGVKPKVDVVDKMDGTCSVSYMPTVEGPYTVNVTYDNKPIKESPFKAKVEPGIKPEHQVKAYGPGLKGGKANTPCNFTVDTREASTPGGLGVTVDGPKEAKIDCKDNGDGTCEFSYVPTVEGNYTVNVTYDDKPIKESPFKAKVLPGETAIGVKAYGPGLEGGKAFQPCTFTVDTKEAKTPGGIGVSIDGPSEATIDCRDNGNNTCDFTYVPVQEGDYTVNVTYAEKPVKGSPFTAKVVPGMPGEPMIMPETQQKARSGVPNTQTDLSGVKAYGPGLSPQGKV